MLAYLFWHRPYPSLDVIGYEQLLADFHHRLAEQSPPGFRGSGSYRIPAIPWLDQQTGYEDWYLVEGSWALDPLNEFAVAGRMDAPHAAVAAGMEAGAGGLYALAWGTPDFPRSRSETWLTRPRGIRWRPALEPIRHPSSGRECWRRQMVFGPAPEFVVISPAGQQVDPPTGWAALAVAGTLLDPSSRT